MMLIEKAWAENMRMPSQRWKGYFSPALKVSSSAITHLPNTFHQSQYVRLLEERSSRSRFKECSRSSDSKSGDISPPPYSKQDVKEETKAALPQAYPRHGLCVPICPHETMSFERYQRIHKLENSSGGFTIEAISGVPTGYHSITTTGAKSIQICRPASNGFENSGRANILEGKGHIYESFGYLNLGMQWTIDLTYHQHLFDSYKSVQDLLDPYRVSLCPHRTLSDPEAAKESLIPLESDDENTGPYWQTRGALQVGNM